jgi:hypothetical protein
MIDTPVVQSDQYHMIRVEPVCIKGNWVNFIHGECLEWSKEIKSKWVDFFNTSGTSYALVNNRKLLKFCLILNASIVCKTKAGLIVRFN